MLLLSYVLQSHPKIERMCNAYLGVLMQFIIVNF
jgi:hypothetical protein